MIRANPKYQLLPQEEFLPDSLLGNKLICDYAVNDAKLMPKEEFHSYIENIFNLLNQDLKNIQEQQLTVARNLLFKNNKQISAEKIIAMILDKAEKIEALKVKENVNKISRNLFNLLLESIKTKDKASEENYQFLFKALTRLRFDQFSTYEEIHKKLLSLKQEYKLTVSKSLFRYAIAFNGGLGAGSVPFTVATAILLNPLTVGVSGGISLLICIIIAKFFFRSYRTKDANLLSQIKEDELSIKKLEKEEVENRIKCYKDLIKIRNLILSSPFKKVDHPIKDKKLLSLIIHNPNFNQENAINFLDKYIDKKIQDYPESKSTNSQLSQIKVPKKESIYSEVFHSKHWGPVVSFLGGTGALYGITKAFLMIAGVTALAGSTMGLGLVVVGAFIAIGLLFSYKQWQFNKETELKKENLNKFRHDQLDKLKTRSDHIKHLSNDLSHLLKNTESQIKIHAFKKNDLETEKKIENQVELSKTNTIIPMVPRPKSRENSHNITYFSSKLKNYSSIAGIFKRKSKLAGELPSHKPRYFPKRDDTQNVLSP